MKKYFPFLLTALGSLLVLAIYFKGFVYAPNSYMVAFGGDAYFIPFNMYYHIIHGSGIWLESMYYPYGELIFMTAAQGSISVILGLIHNAIDISSYLIGITNGQVILEFGISAGILYLILRELNIETAHSILFAIFIGLLSPHIGRFCTGHFSTAHSLTIPAILLLLTKLESEKIKLFFPVLIYCLLVFYGLNDIYQLGLGVMILGWYILIKLVQDRKTIRHTKIVVTSLLIISSSVTVLLIIKLNDPVLDRVSAPAGYLKNLMTKSGILFPQGTVLWPPMQRIFNLNVQPPEGACYLGLVSMVASLAYLSTLLFNWLKTSQIVNLFLIIGILSLMFSFGIPIKWMYEEAQEYLSPIMQFRAPGRFAWISYYCFGIVGAYALNNILKKALEKKYNEVWNHLRFNHYYLELRHKYLSI